MAPFPGKQARGQPKGQHKGVGARVSCVFSRHKEMCTADSPSTPQKRIQSYKKLMTHGGGVGREKGKPVS